METGRVDASSSLPDNRVLLAFGLATLLGGANAVAVRFTVAELPPFWGAAMRFTAAGLIFWLVALLRRSPMPTRSTLWASVWYGVIGFGIAYALLYWGLKTIPAGMAQVILALTPLLTFLFAVLHGLETFRWRGFAGALIAVAGIGLAFYEGGAEPVSLLPMFAIVGGAICFAESTIVIKRVASPDPIITNAIGMSTGAVMLLILSALNGEAWQLPELTSTWLSVIYLVLVGSVVVFYLSVYIIGRWTASASAYILVLMPFVTVALGAWLADEKVGSGLLIGGALVLIGVWVGALARPSPQPRRGVALPAAGEAD
jgi:drug/metabolite transporter (DMT)-like permease